MVCQGLLQLVSGEELRVVTLVNIAERQSVAGGIHAHTRGDVGRYY